MEEDKVEEQIAEAKEESQKVDDLIQSVEEDIEELDKVLNGDTPEEKAEVTTTLLSEEVKEKEPEVKEETEEVPTPDSPKIFSIKTTANREEQVVDFLSANADKKGLEVYSVVQAHGMRSYIFIETSSLYEAEQACFDVPYARGVLKQEIPYAEIEHMVETVKKEVNIQKGDIAEIISGPFKREQCKVSKVDKEKEDVVVELLGSAVPIPITLKMDALKVVRRDSDDD